MRNVFITGGTGKIGSELVSNMILDGHSVVFTSRSQDKADSFISDKGLDPVKCFGMEMNFDQQSDFTNWVGSIPIKVDTIIHNARTIDHLRSDKNGRMSINQFQIEYFMAVTMPYLLTYALLDAGHDLKDIVFIGSMYGTVAPTPSLYDNFENSSPINYGPAKAAQIHLTKELAVRLREREVRVNCISYGGLVGRVDEAFRMRYNKLNPLNRMLNNQDLYPPVQFLLNNPGLAINGENIQVDGGWTIW